jgi:cytochrome oxidase Cu insertion factor (SCO1/SenC/PrrC family)
MDVDRKDVVPIAEKYKVTTIPAVFVMDAEGKVVGTIEFTPSPDKFASDLNRIIKSRRGADKGGSPAHGAAKK